MEKINCQARYVILTSYTKISKGIGFTYHAACQPVTPENIRVSHKEMKFFQLYALLRGESS